MNRIERIALITAVMWAQKSDENTAESTIDDLVENAVRLESRVRHVLDITEPCSEDIDLLTTYEAARYLGMSPGSLSNWRSTGRGPTYIKLGSKVMYRKAEVERFIQDKQKGSDFDFLKVTGRAMRGCPGCPK